MDVAALPFRPRDRAVYLPGPDALVLADLHLGRGAAAAVELPLPDEVVSRLAGLVERWSPATVVLAGDVLHSFDHVTDAVASALEAVRDAAADATLQVVAGNHDGRIDDVCDPVEELRLDDGTVVCHGHEAPAADGDRYVVGHDHPAIVIEGRRYPCYLYGEAAYRDAAVVALPAFNPLARGTPVNRLARDDPSSPLLADVGTFSPVVRDEAADETFVFPPLSQTRDFLVGPR